MSLRATLRWQVAALLCAGVFGGCAASRDLAPFSPCGGDLVGRWRVEKSGFAINRYERRRGCTIEKNLAKFELRGTYEFRADRTYRFDLRGDGDWVLIGPAQCGDKTSSCEQIEEGHRKLLAMGEEPPHATVTCSGTTVCTCVHKVSDKRMKSGGSFAVEGTTLLLGTDNKLDYCVRDDTLWLNATYGTGALGSDDDLNGTLQLVRVPAYGPKSWSRTGEVTELILSHKSGLNTAGWVW